MATKCKLIYLPPAATDILNIVRFHADKAGPEYAREIYRTIQETICGLQQFPLMGSLHPDPELAALGYRKLVLTKTYVSIYKVTDNVVTIYRVVNGAIDYPKLLK